MILFDQVENYAEYFRKLGVITEQQVEEIKLAAERERQHINTVSSCRPARLRWEAVMPANPTQRNENTRP